MVSSESFSIGNTAEKQPSTARGHGTVWGEVYVIPTKGNRAVAQVTLLYGPAGTGKTQAVLQRYRRKVEADGTSRVLLLLPHPRALERARRILLAEGCPVGLFNPLIMTFPELASRLLDENGETATETAPVLQRLLLREAVTRVRTQMGLTHLEQVADFDGLVDALAEFIDELKRGAIDAESFAQGLKEAGFETDREADLCAIYSNYQALLHQLQFFDPAGRFWWARDVLRSGRRQPFEEVELLLVDGFDDFTPTQLEVLRLLAEHVQEVVFTLCMEMDEGRSELFHVSRETLAHLQDVFGHVELVPVGFDSADASPLGRVRFELFSETAQAGPAEGQVRVIEAPGRAREVREIAREIKQLLLDEYKPDDIVVIFRSLTQYVPLLRAVFEEFGIPLYVASPECLDRLPLGQMVLLMVRLVVEDFPRELMISFLRSGFVSLEGYEKEIVDDLDRFARAAGVIRGADQWTQRLQAHRQRLEYLRTVEAGEDPDLAMAPAAQAAMDLSRLDQCIDLVHRTLRQLAKLGQPQSLRQFVETLQRLMLHFGLGRLHESVADTQSEQSLSRLRRRDILALDAILEALDWIAFTAQQFSSAAGKLSPAEFLSILDDTFRTAEVTPDGRSEGKVYALEAHDARQLRFRAVFIGGLVEGEFPRQRHEGLFYRDDERRALADSGLKLQQRLQRQAEEMYLFYQAATRATERLYLTYPTMDEQGREVLRSCYVDDATALFGGEGGVQVRRIRPSDVSVPVEESFTRRELLEATWEGLWRRGRTEPANDILVAAYNTLLAQPYTPISAAAWGAYIETRRDSKEPFDEYDGVISAPPLLRRLSDRFGPDHRFSASGLSDYGSCPFGYFARRVLGLEALEEPLEEVEARDRGRLYHEVLRRFFERINKETGSAAITEAKLERVKPIMEAVVQEVFDEAVQRAVATSRTLLELERDECLLSMERFLKQEADRFAEHQPTMFEVMFGMAPPDQPLQLGSGGERVLLRGKIDRIDVLADLGRPSERNEPDLLIAVMDYKTGKAASKRDIQMGTDLQLPLYALAAENVVYAGRSALCCRWTYRHIRRPLELNGDVRKEDEIAQLKEQAVKHAKEYAGLIRSGKFPVAPKADRCGSCDFKGMCRYEESRTRKKLRADDNDA